MTKPSVIIVTPALPNANNGNGQTSLRYQKHLEANYDIKLCTEWSGISPHEPEPSAMLALHARKSASSIQAWADFKHSTHNVPGLAVVLSGTDLYCDLPDDPLARRSLQQASHLVVLQELGVNTVPSNYRDKVQVIHQCVDIELPARKEVKGSRFKVIMVGHLREVKDPMTYMRAARLMASEADIDWLHIGRCEDTEFLKAIRETEALNSNYRWCDAMDHQEVLSSIADSDLLVHCSIAEGSPHVVIEAMCIGTPVLASEVEGNQGTLGLNYQGFFPVRDHEVLAARVSRLAKEWRDGVNVGLKSELVCQVLDRAELFSMSSESQKLNMLVQKLLDSRNIK